MKKVFMIAVPGIALLSMAFSAPGDVTVEPDGQYWTVKSSADFSADDLRDLRDDLAQIYGVDASVEQTYKMTDGSALGYHDDCTLDQGFGAKASLSTKISRTSVLHSSTNMSVQEADIRSILSKYSK